MAGFEREGELYANSRRRVGVVGKVAFAFGVARDGDADRFEEGGVTSVCRIDVKIAFACSFNASDSVGMIRFFDGVDGVVSSIR